jgi:CheY-like chemotaxis protein
MRPRKILIVEDEYFLADDCAQLAKDAGFEVVGPYDSVREAIDNLPNQLDCALLDINVDGMSIYPLVDVLLDRSIRITLYTGYERDKIPERYRSLTVITKPGDCSQALHSLV